MARRMVVVGNQQAGGVGRRPPEPPGPPPRERAEQLHASGMPFQLAMSVARGRLTLNEALEQMARLERVERLIREHEVSRALAMQIALGQASLETVLAKRRLAEHRGSHRERSCLDDAAASGEALTLGLVDGSSVKGPVQAVDAYTIRVGEGAAAKEVHKLQASFAYASSAWKAAKKALRTDPALAKKGLRPSLRPQDRYNCSDRRLFRYVDTACEVQVTLLDGTLLRGVITWFSRFEFAVRVKDAEVFVFRHALSEVAEIEPRR